MLVSGAVCYLCWTVWVSVEVEHQKVSTVFENAVLFAPPPKNILFVHEAATSEM
jgi:hypothetical protein